MGKSLYRSYRSTSFDEIIGQKHITETLKNSLKTGSVSHAYLLSGPRGVGKTSIARILAYAVNDQPYDLETTNLDIIEIDAASNRRIDEIRDIREKVHIAPTIGKYKVYIIDEVHMLTREAFNALLKTLEEPPEHVIFILATTESHKVPETILSRCIRLTFKPIEDEILAEHLTSIAKQEKINISKDALLLLAKHGNGSFRDAISLLEQVKNLSDKIDVEQVITMLGLAPDDVVENIISAMAESDIKSLISNLDDAYDKGSDVGTLSSQIQEHLRNSLILNQNTLLTDEQIISLQKELLYVPGSVKPRIALEITLSNVAINNTNSLEKESKAQSAEVMDQNKPDEKPKTINQSVNTPRIKETIPKKSLEESTKDWSLCLDKLKEVNNTLYGIARMAKAKKSQNQVHLYFNFKFHQKQIEESKNRAILSKILKEVYGESIELVTSVLDKSKPITKDNKTDELSNLSNIFGAHEVLES